MNKRQRLLQQDPNMVLGQFIGPDSTEYQAQYVCNNGARLKLADKSCHIADFINDKKEPIDFEKTGLDFLFDYPDYKNDWNALHKVLDKLKEQSFFLLIEPVDNLDSNYMLSNNIETFCFTGPDAKEAIYNIIIETVSYLLKDEI